LLGIIDQAKLMYDYHSNLVATHPFSSVWYEWPIMYKPVWFYSGTVSNITRTTIVDIGNPAIWWFGIVSFIYVVISAIKKNRESLLILIFILCTFIPYIFIGRIMFMYHYFPTLPFVMLAIVSFMKYITEKTKTNMYLKFYIALIVITFFVFYPVSSGMITTSEYVDALKWLSSWIF
jgi:dolichyl-phosphate-mannose--protein O-mannosyl transferase